MLVAAMNRRDFLIHTPALSAAAAAAAPNNSSIIRRVDIIHHTHTDVGYTDLPSVCRDMPQTTVFTHLEPLEDPASWNDRGLDRSGA